MHRLTRILVGAALVSFAFADTALAIQVNIDTSGYRGQWTLDYGEAKRGGARVDVKAGSHVISISGAELFFDVAPDGSVVPENRLSASGGSGALTFRTSAIYIDPALFEGRWRISAGATRDFSGPKTVTLVSGLRFYNLGVGSSGGFAFDIAGDGTVTVHSQLAATGGLRRLRLHNTEKFPALRARRQATQ